MSFPRWAAPFLGLGVGALLGLYVSLKEGPVQAGPPLMGAIIGLVGGLLILVLESKPRAPRDDQGQKS
jgi:hypothetical protein